MAEFDPKARYVPHDLSKACSEALDQGWTAKRSGAGWMLRSPKRTQKFHVPSHTRDANGLASRLRDLITKAWVAEDNAFRPDVPKGFAEDLMENLKGLEGATIRPGGNPVIECNDCDREFTSWEGYAGHQKVCLANVAAHMAADQEQDGDLDPEEVSEPQIDSEDIAQNGDLNEESQANGTKMVNREEAVAEVATGKKRGGYKWVHPKGVLHRAIYQALRDNKRRKDETETVWAERLVAYIERRSLLEEFASTEDSEAEQTLEAIRVLVGGGEVDELKNKLAEAEAMAEKARETLRTFASLAEEGL